MNESMLFDDRAHVKKTIATDQNIDTVPDPFLIAGTFVESGAGKALVCAVGKNSRREDTEFKLDTDKKTPLQIKLDKLAGVFTYYGILGALIILVASLLNFTIRLIIDDKSSELASILSDISLYFTQFITIIIVAVPEGLPLVIMLSLAYSVQRMKSDGLLIRDLNSTEVMGRVDQILIGKTGTLTTGELEVDSFYVQKKVVFNKRSNTLLKVDLSESVIKLI